MPLKIEDYGLIGDCVSAALVGRDGSIDWLCWPRFDSGACFANLLGTPENGRWRIAPSAADVTVTRAYRGDTLILETTFETEAGAAVVIDFMPVQKEHPHVTRIVKGLRGKIDFRTEFIIRFDYGWIVPWVSRQDDGSLQAVAGPDRVVLRAPVVLEPQGMSHVGDFAVASGETVAFTLTYGSSFGGELPPIDAESELADTESLWRRWSDRCQASGRWAKEIRRSLLTLRAMIHYESGGMVAAPTTSLPEKIGGARNWDYRFCWLRDATFTLLALMNGDHDDEARSWRDWLARAIAGEPSKVQILYGIGGERRISEVDLDWLAGYEGSRPVRAGNAASAQFQIDIYGEVFDALYQARVRGLSGKDEDWRLQCALLEHLATVWKEPDESIWEVRGGARHFVYSKVMAWVAFDRAVKSVEKFALEGPLDHWREIRDAIHEDVCTKGFDVERGTFVQSYGSKEVDASALLIPLVGFLPPEDKRVRGTIAAIEKDLLVDGLVLRYDTGKSEDGLPPGEGVFLACSFWYVDNLVMQDRLDEAVTMFERLISLQNDLGLLSEEYDPIDKRLVGNFPQAFSHIALVNSASNLERAAKPAEQRTES